MPHNMYAYIPHNILQLIEILGSVINGPQLDIPDILKKYFLRSTWTIFTFLSLKAIFEKSFRSCLTDINQHLLSELDSTIWNSIESVFQ